MAFNLTIRILPAVLFLLHMHRAKAGQAADVGAVEQITIYEVTNEKH